MTTYPDRVLAATQRLGRDFDAWCNAVTGGNPNQTVSERSALDAKDGKLPGCIMCGLLSVMVQWQHCAKTLDPNATTPISAYVRAGLCFILLIGLAGVQIIRVVEFIVSAIIQ